MLYDLDKMNSVKDLKKILSVSDDLIDESNLMGLSSVITLRADRSLNNVSAEHYEAIINTLVETGTLTDRKNDYYQETHEETGMDYNVLYKYSITINFDELNEFRDRLIQRIKELKEEKPSSNPYQFLHEFPDRNHFFYLSKSLFLREY